MPQIKMHVELFSVEWKIISEYVYNIIFQYASNIECIK